MEKVWQNFIDTGSITDNKIKAVVAEAWLRCRIKGLNPLSYPSTVHISQQELAERLKNKEELFNSAKPFIEALFSIIQGSRYIIGLADESGCLLRVYGDGIILETAKNIDIVPGANWNEDIKGNNAIGTALAIGDAVQMTGPEHYLKVFHDWTCSGAPVYGPDGLMTGVLLVAAPRNSVHPHTLGMIIATVRAIQQSLVLERQNQALNAVNHFIIESSPYAVITVNDTGNIILYNKTAEKLTGISSFTALGQNPDIIFSCEGTENGSFTKILKSTLETGRPLKNFQRTFSLPTGREKLCTVNTYPLAGPSNDIIGVMAVIRGFNDRRSKTKSNYQPAQPADSLSISDSLTNLYNHKYFHERLDEEVYRAYLQNTKVSLIMLDIDCFKHYNDVLGYRTGDKLLAEFAKLLRSLVRSEDIVARFGGEEFTVILADADDKLAFDIAERIRISIEDYPFDGREVQPKGKLTVSIGIATYPRNAASKEELLKAAEEALYRAKHAAESRVALYYSVFDDLKSELNHSDLSLLNTIKTLITVVNAKDKYTFGHSERVLRYSTVLAEQVGLGDEQVKYIKYGAYLHDIGKIEIGREVLNKQEPLTADEWTVLQCHPQWGADIVKPVTALKQILPQILHHHERFDGEGYPNGLKGTEIPLNARILAIADSFDAMTTTRPYQEARSLKGAVQEIRRCAGTQFDPQLIEAFIKALKNIQFEDKELVS